MKKLYCLLLLMLLLLTSCLISAGSYAYAERYIVDSPSRDSLVRKIEMFKRIHGMDLLDNNTEIDTLANCDGLSYNYYMIHFKIKDDNNDTIVYMCAINMSEYISDSSEVVLELISISEDVKTLRWKRINTDELPRKKNQYYKKVFEKEVLDKLGGMGEKVND